jgi:uncharacterized protein
MIIDVSLKETGAFRFDYNDDTLTEGQLARFKAPALISGEYEKVGSGFAVSGRIIYDLIYPCSMCLMPVEKHYDLSFGELFNEDGEEYKVVDGEIDIQPLVEEAIILHTEGRVLCTENCKGLCPKCGKNLNNGSCDCDTVTADIGENPFAILKDLNTGGAKDGSTKKKNI